METPNLKTKVVVYTKSGQKLTYYEKATYEECKEAWRSYLTKKAEAVSFGNFAISIDNIDYVHVAHTN